MTKIVVVTDAWTPQVNGVVRTLTTTIGILRQRGYTVETVTPDLFKSVAVPFYPEIRLALPPYGMVDRLLDANAVHISTEGPLGLAARAACKTLKRPYTTAYHTQFPMYLKDKMGVPEGLTYRWLRWFHKDSDAVMVPTRSMIEELEEHGFTNAKLWGRGVDQTLFHPRALADIPEANRFPADWPKPFFLNVGRISSEKNLDAFLSLDLPGTKIVVGDGPDRVALEAKYPQAKFVGAKSGLDLAYCYNQCDVFVFPSKSDTFGLVNIEALASGIPVAAYPVTGPRDIVEHGVTGALSDDLKKACLFCLTLTIPRDRHYSWDAATDQFVSYLAVAP